MKAGIIVLCRFSSNRLPGKILKPIDGKPILAYILERLSHSNYAHNLVVATSNEQTDDPIAKWCQENSVRIFRGSLDNVSQRFMDCAAENQFDLAVRVNGDNIFTDSGLLDYGVQLAIQGHYDFVSNVKNRTFPTGMSIEVINTKFYSHVLPLFRSKEDFEHVTKYIYEHEEAANVSYFYNNDLKEAGGYRLALDDHEDLVRIEGILSKMKKPHDEYRWEEIVKLALNE